MLVVRGPNYPNNEAVYIQFAHDLTTAAGKPDEATDDIEFASFVTGGHGAKRPARISNWCGWVVSVGVDD